MHASSLGLVVYEKLYEGIWAQSFWLDHMFNGMKCAVFPNTVMLWYDTDEVAVLKDMS
jgi:hypothetical protein